MKKTGIPIIVFIFSLIGALLIGAVVSSQLVSMHYLLKEKEPGYVPEYSDVEPSLEKVAEVIDEFNSHYIGEVNSEDYQKALIDAYIEATNDRWARYYTKEEWDDELASLNGQSSGIGVLMSLKEDKGSEERNTTIIVSRVFPDSGAERAGILPGDIITSAAGVSSRGMSLEEIRGYILGENGTTVEIGILRGEEELTLTVERGEYTVVSVESKMLKDGKTGFIRITSFNRTTDGEFADCLKSLTDAGAQRLIIDLRDNGGGLIDPTANILDTLLPEGTIYSLRDKNGVVESRTSDDAELDMPMALLVNGNSASASELFTAALKDYKKAIIVGSRTYGKGVAQSTFPLSAGAMLKVTTYYFDSPLGSNYHKQGIDPDVEASPASDDFNYYVADESEDAELKAALDALDSQGK